MEAITTLPPPHYTNKRPQWKPASVQIARRAKPRLPCLATVTVPGKCASTTTGELIQCGPQPFAGRPSHLRLPADAHPEMLRHVKEFSRHNTGVILLPQQLVELVYRALQQFW